MKVERHHDGWWVVPYLDGVQLDQAIGPFKTQTEAQRSVADFRKMFEDLRTRIS